MKDWKDNALMMAYRTGNIEAFEILYGRYRKKLFVYAYSLLKRKDEAADALHEVFTRLIQNTVKFCEARNLSSFLYVICRNYCLNLLRRRKYEVQVEFQSFELLKNGNPLQEIVKNEEVRLLNKEIDSLPLDQREIVVLKVYGEMTFRQIAQTTGLPQGTVISRHRLAMKSLKSALQMQGGRSVEIQ